MANVVLLGDRVTPFTEKVVRALALKGVEWELRVPRDRDEIRRWNPVTHQIPVLLLEGERIHDSTAIVLRLEDRFPRPSLLSEDPKVAASQRRLHDWAEQMLMHYWTSWLRAVARSGQGGGSGGWLRRRLGGLVAADGAEALGRPGAVVAELGHRLDDMVGFLGARPFFFADRPSMADLAVYAGLHGLGTVAPAPAMIAARPPLTALIERIEDLTGGPVPDSARPPGGRPLWIDTR